MQRETRLQRSHLLGTSVNLKPVDSNPIFQSFCFGGDYITGESNIISTNTSNKFSV